MNRVSLISVVDDDESVRESLESLLKSACFQVKSALSLLKAAEKRRWRLPEEKPFAIAVALHHGIATRGNVGRVAQRDSTIIGDTVNTVFRIESVMKLLNQRLALSQDFLGSLPSPGIDLNDLGEHQLKGKYQAVRLFGMA